MAEFISELKRITEKFVKMTNEERLASVPSHSSLYFECVDKTEDAALTFSYDPVEVTINRHGELLYTEYARNDRY